MQHEDNEDTAVDRVNILIEIQFVPPSVKELKTPWLIFDRGSTRSFKRIIKLVGFSDF